VFRRGKLIIIIIITRAHTQKEHTQTHDTNITHDHTKGHPPHSTTIEGGDGDGMFPRHETISERLYAAVLTCSEKRHTLPPAMKYDNTIAPIAVDSAAGAAMAAATECCRRHREWVRDYWLHIKQTMKCNTKIRTQ